MDKKNRLGILRKTLENHVLTQTTLGAIHECTHLDDRVDCLPLGLRLESRASRVVDLGQVAASPRQSADVALLPSVPMKYH